MIGSFVQTHEDKDVIAICVTSHGSLQPDEYGCILGEDRIPCPVKNILELLNVNSQQPKVDLIFSHSFGRKNGCVM